MEIDFNSYQPTFKPWLEKNCKEFMQFVRATKGRTLISIDRLWYLYSLGKQCAYVPGCWYECGVYQGGSAAMLASMLVAFAPIKNLYLFDTFKGMPETNPDIDAHSKGDFADTSLNAVTTFINEQAPKANIFYEQGTIPQSFWVLHKAARQISFAHVDVDIYASVKACTEYIYSHLSPGGTIVYDDYGFKQCHGARKAIDEFFSDKPEIPIVLQSGQAVIIRLPR